MAQLTRVSSLAFTEASAHHEMLCAQQVDSDNNEMVPVKSLINGNVKNGFVNPVFDGATKTVSIPITFNMEKEKDDLKEQSEEPKGSLIINGNVRNVTENGGGVVTHKPLMKAYSSVSMPGRPADEAAIMVLNACKSYKGGGKQRPILHNLCMTVKKGTIYSLLGSSGCGKTTLLSCVVGMKHLDSGKILVYGAKTGTRQSGVPGKMVGYMPQDSALYGDFSIKETIAYFGSLYGMSHSEIETSKEFLVNLLSLPDESRRVSTLSGGQRRRVSLAVTLVHSPALIILDEPTVGVDPLLRDNIWKHLLNLVSDGQTTVIITTHYIDEAKNSDNVGVMRGGRLLTEKPPKELFEEFKTQSLEEVVLKLCHDDEHAPVGYGRARSKSSGNILKCEMDRRLSQLSKKDSVGLPSCSGGSPFEETFPQAVRNSFTRIRSLTMKNAFVMLRNIFLVLFVIFMPAMQTVIMGMSMGNDPRPIKVGVVNHEFNQSDSCNLDRPRLKDECEVANLSCRFLQSLPQETIQLINYMTADDAREDIKSGKLRSFVIFPEDFSDYMYERSTSGVAVDNDTLIGSTILFEMDASNAVVTKSLQRIIFESYKTFVRDLLASCGLNPDLGGLPIKFQNPIYGRYDLELRDYVATGMLVGVALFFPLCSSSITYIWDKKQGTMERARVAGTQTWEIMMSYFVTEGTILLGQTCCSFLILMFFFKIPIVGSSSLAFMLVVLNGFAGISLGLLLASICNEEIQAILMGLAIIFPNFFLAGAMWPIEGMPIVLQYMSYALPGTLACEAFRSIVVRGWGFAHLFVWSGFVSTFAWMCLYWILSIYLHRVTLAKK